MNRTDIASIVRPVVDDLVNKDYQAALAKCAGSRLSADDIRRAIEEYGRVLVTPPDDAFQKLDAVGIRDRESPTWSVWVPLWTQEEGRSDLTLQLTLTDAPNGWRIEIDDLRVP